MAGVKIETDDEKLADGEEASARFEPLSGAINGISREKASAVARLWRGKQMARKHRSFFMAHGRNYKVLRGFSRRFFMGQRRGQGNDGQRIGAQRCERAMEIGFGALLRRIMLARGGR
jgi:hypothetical protein